MQIMKKHLLLLIALAGLFLSALPAAAQISVVNTGSLNNIADQTSYTLSFNAGNGGTASKLIVSAGTETAAATLITGITYNGAALTLIPNTGTTGRSRGIWYLDNPFSGGAADIVVSGNGGTFAHMRLGVASISGSAPGVAIANITGAASVSLNVPVADSFVFAAYAGNGSSPATTADAPLTQIFGVTGDSANMAAGYQNLVPAGTATYSFSSTNAPQALAAAFVPISAAPVIVSTTPANGATSVAIGANLVASFSEPVVFGTGNIELWQVGGGSPVEIFNVTIPAEVAFSGQTLTINPTSNLTPGVEYYVLIPATAVVDTSGGAAFAGISDPTAWSFTADGTAPTLVSLNPADDAPAVPVSSNLVATFSEPVAAGTGNIELWQDGGGSPLETFDVTLPSEVAFSGATLTINPTADLTPGTGYYILIPATAVVDASTNAFAGITDPTAWNFSGDNTPPTVASLSPADGSASVVLDANLVATFSEPVVAGTGTIELWKAGDGAPLESFDVTLPAEVAFSGASFTINPTANFDLGTEYYVIIPATAVKDLSGNFFSGLTVNTDWNFSATASGIWTGTTSGAWLTATNWSASVIPGSASTATNTDGALFDVATQPTVGINMNTTAGNYYLGVIDFNNGTARNIGNSSTTATGVLTLNGTTVNSVANTVLSNRNSALLTIQAIQGSGLAMGLALGNATDNIVQITGSGGIRIDSVITGTDRKLTKQGSGTGALTLANAVNSFSGGLDILAGNVQLNPGTTAGSGTIQLGATSGTDNAELRLAGTGSNPANALTVVTGSSGTKTLANRSSNTVTYSGQITASDNLAIFANTNQITISNVANTIATGKTVSFSNVGGAIVNSAIWGGDGSISYTSSGAAGFSGLSANSTYSGGTTLAAMSGNGTLTVGQSSTGPANAPTSGPFGTGTLSIGATRMQGGTGSNVTIGNAITFTDNPSFTTRASEKSLIFPGNASLGATRTLTVDLGSTVPGTFVEFSGEISGSTFGITKAGAGTLRLSGTNTYTGDTTVNAGVLAVTGTSIDNTAKLVINGSGKVDLTNTETVAALDFDGTPQPSGDYSTSGVPLGASIDTDSFSGTGTLTVGASANNYASWAALQMPPVTEGPNGDDDKDGVKNLVEYALADGQERGTLTGTSLSFTKRGAPYGGDLTYAIETSDDLGISDPWTTVTPTLDDASTISYTLQNPGDNFARLKVIQLP
jgi:autotransporter-associated beta strand protein